MVCDDPDWQRGAAWGAPRPGHPEGTVLAHIADVLANVEREARSPEERRRLRLVALLHDVGKVDVDRSRPRVGTNQHGFRARRLAERFIAEPCILEVIELHDEGYNSWLTGKRRRDWERAEKRARRLLERLGPALPLYLAFFRADNATAGKSRDSLAWFERLIGEVAPASAS